MEAPKLLHSGSSSSSTSDGSGRAAAAAAAAAATATAAAAAAVDDLFSPFEGTKTAALTYKIMVHERSPLLHYLRSVMDVRLPILQ